MHLLEAYKPISKDKFFIPLEYLISKCRLVTADERFGAQKITNYLKSNLKFQPLKKAAGSNTSVTGKKKKKNNKNTS